MTSTAPRFSMRRSLAGVEDVPADADSTVIRLMTKIPGNDRSATTAAFTELKLRVLNHFIWLIISDLEASFDSVLNAFLACCGSYPGESMF